jgi:large subunit ribosomal protein L25
MASRATLKAQPRREQGKSATRKMRAAGRVPAVVYGHGDDTRMVTIDAHELDLLFKRVHYENTIIEVDIEGEGGPVKTLVKEVQSHPVRMEVLHVDFQQVHAGEAIHVDVPTRLIGTPPGVRAGGVLMHTLTDIRVRCMPDSIPEVIDIDISGLEINDSIHLRDIQLPAGVEADIDADQTICGVAPPAVGAPSEAVAEPAQDEPEVISRGREDEE